MMTYDEYREKEWTSKRGLLREAPTRKERLEYIRLLNDFMAGHVKPSVVVGTGYKNPRKVAERWIKQKIKDLIHTIATRGDSETMRANYRCYCKNGLEGGS